jgi:phosphosulfolactate synthase
MNSANLALPPREAKPRKHGLTIVIDNGVPLAHFQDVMSSMGGLVDLVKFGWGTAVVSDMLERKIASLRENNVGYFFGGTLLEKFVSQHHTDAYFDMCRTYGCRYVEVSNGTIDLSNKDKAQLIREVANDFHVLSEVGYKDSERSLHLAPSQWVEFIRQDLAAGAEYVITEARETGTSGICRADGEVRYGLIEDILSSGVDPNRLIFEAPKKELQVYFIKRLGSQVNLANIAMTDIIPLETLRLGLRSDTLLLFDDALPEAYS